MTSAVGGMVQGSILDFLSKAFNVRDVQAAAVLITYRYTMF
jgi:hypothetical protein